jgi:hypothetical protein
MNGLVDRGTFQLSLRSEAGPNASVLPSRFVLSIKRADDGEEIYKARLVVGGSQGQVQELLGTYKKYNNADVHPNAGSDCRHILFSLVVDGCYTGIFT